LIVSSFTVVEPFESWETLDSIFLGDFLLFSGVNLGNEEWWIILGKGGGSSNVFWSKFFAVSTPWGVEFYKKIFVFLDLFIEVGVGENKNTLVELSSEDRVNTDSNQCKK
jgi:hypothetical protein